jgi:hypothetical protein
MIRVALSEESLQSLEGDASRRRLIRVGLNLVPFAGIAFLWFIGVVASRSAWRLRSACSQQCFWAADCAFWP